MRHCRSWTIAVFAAATLLAPAQAATVSASFSVSVQLAGAPGCDSRSPGPCGGGGSIAVGIPPAVGGNAPGPRIPTALNRLVAPLSVDSVLAKALGGDYSGAGTVTSWRLVDNEGREYLEITLGW